MKPVCFVAPFGLQRALINWVSEIHKISDSSKCFYYELVTLFTHMFEYLHVQFHIITKNDLVLYDKYLYAKSRMPANC